MADYFGHWLNDLKVANPPKVFFVNWFKKDSNGKFMWPGFSDNFRIIKWMLDRVDGKVSAKDTPVGLLPNISDLNLAGLDISEETMNYLFEIKKDEWQREIAGIEEFYSQFGERLPTELRNHLADLKRRMQ
jgi:phosphoenolpyruvate carboxykinase (GTP)